MQYLFYRHRGDSRRELVLPAGAPFPQHFYEQDWYLHATHGRVSERTAMDIGSIGYSERGTGVVFGRKAAPRAHINLMRRPSA
jgi:hypothetical protein